MKTLKLTVVLFSVGLLLSNCNSRDRKWDSKSSADSLNSMKSPVADSSKSITKDLIMTVNKGDAKFAVAAADGGMAEVELGKLAVANASSQQVKDFGAMMVKDHSAANEKLQFLAEKKGISLPKTLSAEEQKIKDGLSLKTGKDFDNAYVKAMVKDHQDDIKDFNDAAQTLTDQDLKDFAKSTLPVLKTHLTAIEKIDNSVKK